jgi:ABC-type antimicrobial peptide transport system permease subunit
MNLLESISSGLAALWTHKLRSALTLVGIVVGAASVVAMFSFVSGLKARVIEDFRHLGFDNVFFIGNHHVHNPDNLASLKASKGLTLHDTEVLLAEVPEIQQLCPATESYLVARAGSEARRCPTFGVSPDGFPILKLEIGEGRFLTWTDVKEHSRVCVMGQLIKERLFGEDDAVGRTILLGDEEFTIVGVLRLKEFSAMFGNSGQEQHHQRIYIPMTTSMYYLTGSKRLAYFALRLREGTDISAAYEKIHAILLREHRQIEDFQIENVAQNIAEAIAAVDRIAAIWSTILGSIATVSLLVGGIGLLSVLLISVNERLREIGIRKAVGAKDRAVFQQFLVEAVTISGVGGLAGLSLGAGLCKLISIFAARAGQGVEIPVSGTGMLLGIGFAIGVGLLFGLYPAFKASRLDPITAISRHA